MSSQDLINEAMKFLNFDKTPSMKELNTRYRKMALIKHPDKNGGSIASKEDYQNLLKYYRILGNYVFEQKNDDYTQEENDNRDIFKNFNFDQKNKFSHTIIVENNLANGWKHVLTEKMGDPVDQNANGLKYQCTVRRFFPKKVALIILLTHFLRMKIVKNKI